MAKKRSMSVTNSRLSNSFKSLALWLKKHRQERGLTMRDVGEAISAPHSMVGKVENSERNLSVVEYIMYCDALGADPIEGIKAILDQVRGEFKQQRAVKVSAATDLTQEKKAA